MKKVKSKNEKDSGMDVVQTTCRLRPSGVSGKFDAVVPKSSKDGVAYTFVVDRPTFNLWVKAIKLRYWIDLGVREEFNVKWDSDTNDNGTVTKRLVRVFRVDESEEALLFAVTCFDTKCKIMVQGNHRDLWVENEFPILKKIVIGLRDQVEDISELYKESAGLELQISVDDLVLSEDEAGTGEARNESAAAIERLPVTNDNIEDGDASDFESDSEFYGWLSKEVKKSRKEHRDKTKSKGKKSPKRLRRSVSVISKRSVTKPAKDAKSKSEDTGSQDLLNVRVLKLEDQLEKMENIISNKEQNTVFQEDLIRQIVDSVIQDIF